LAFDGGRKRNVTLLSVPEDVKNLYSEPIFSWFSYYPTKIEIDLTNRCNLQCIHCSRMASPVAPVKGELTIGEIKAFISQAAKLGVFSLQLMGGEPLVYKGFFEVCEHARVHGVRHLNTSSNGFAIGPDLARRLSGYFSEIQLSLHGATANTHDRIVGKQGAFRRLCLAAEILSAAGVRVNLSFTVMEHNINEIEMVPEVAKDMGAVSLRYLALSDQGRGHALKQWSGRDRSQIGARIRRIYLQQKDTGPLDIRAGGFPPFSAMNTKATFFGCPAGRDLLYVRSDGCVSCCGVVEEYVGSIRESAVEELWHKHPMVTLRKTPNCECEYRFVCSGPCVAGFKKPYSDKANLYEKCGKELSPKGRKKSNDQIGYEASVHSQSGKETTSNR
jgi:radical SAM protein with 4Fe4S-binding SPASM domain